MAQETEQIRHLYIHIPFCKSKCGYCSFYSKVPEADEQASFIKTLLIELDYYKKHYELDCETIYLGGGTPSLLEHKQLETIIRQIPRQNNCEITLEANPGDISESKVLNWKKLGINRVSIGLQSMKDNELEFLGRRHNVAESKEAIRLLQNNEIKNISFDLIYGLPGQKLEDVEYSLNQYLSLSPEHISTYCLSLADDCALAGYKNKLPSDETVSDMYYMIRSMLLSKGWRHYELSSFCRGDKESRHNMAYWTHRKYLGSGPSAAGYVSSFRYQNPASYDQWQQAIKASKYFNNREDIGEVIREKEYIILALRTTKGLNLADFNKKFKIDFLTKYREILVKYQELKLLEQHDGNIRLLPEGYFISNEILSNFV
ncbi:MAG: radical SAM family heme chaperone HemW [Candidatus Stygibacter frigidus]|nr:radical SAM family heme chaperone HemW [Candidatus Stygibacter frigidus]